MASTRFVMVITFWSYQCLPDFLMVLPGQAKYQSPSPDPPQSIEDLPHQITHGKKPLLTLSQPPKSQMQLRNYKGFFHQHKQTCLFCLCLISGP